MPRLHRPMHRARLVGEANGGDDLAFSYIQFCDATEDFRVA